MLSISNLGSNLDYYLELATVEYYLNGGEPPGRWFGRGAKQLGLSGMVDKEQLRNLAAGFSADGKRKLVQNGGKEDRQVGWDLTFSAPKSVSVLWSIAPDHIRRVIQECHDSAVQEAISYLQDEWAFSRTGKGGRGREAVGLVVGCFEHGTSRAHDPQLHTHALVLNLGVDSDDKTRAIISNLFFHQKLTTGAIYRLELAHQLVGQLGVQLEKSGFAFAVKGVPKKLCEFYSKRRMEIERALQAVSKTSARAAQLATLETRSQKDCKPRAEHFETWANEAREFGFDTSSVERLIGKAPVRQTPVKSIDSTIRGLAAKHSYFSHSEVLRDSAILSQHQGVSAQRLRRTLGEFVSKSSEIVEVKDRIYSTQKNVELESELLDAVARMSEDNSHVASIKIVEDQLIRDGKKGKRKQNSLSWEQSAAVSHITMAPGAVQIVAGKAGVGKTQLLKVATGIWQKSGLKVYGACISGKAARGLQDATGIQSETVAKILFDANQTVRSKALHHGKQVVRAAFGKPTRRLKPAFKLDSKSVLVLDEAGMVGTQHLHAIIQEVERAGAKLVLVGDSYQLQPIAPGNPFRSLSKLFGSVQIDEIKRQASAFDRKVVDDLSCGRIEDAIRSLDERGFVHVADNRQLAMKELVEHWGVSRHRADPIFVPTRAEASVVNQSCQRYRKLQKELGGWKLLKVRGQKFYSGDRILFERRDRKLGVENGYFGTIEKINESRKLITVKLDSGKRVLVPVKRYADFSLGYATTVHKGQGATVANAFVLLGGSMQDRFLSYVQMSRARGQTHVYVDRLEADANFQGIISQMKRGDSRPLAADLSEHSRTSTKQLRPSPTL